jgi:sulfate adenylyltransferase subunit 1
VQRVSRPGESFRGYQGTVAGGAIKPGDSVVVLPSGTVANVSKIVTFDLVRNAAVAGDAITLVLDRQVDIARGDVIASLDARPFVGLSFDARLVALQPEGIAGGKRYWLKSSSRRQRVTVETRSVLDLNSGHWQPADRLDMNAIGSVRLAFDEPAIFDPYEKNRNTGSFILIDPDTNNTVAGGMVTGKHADISSIGTRTDGEQAVLSLPADLAREILALDMVKERHEEITVRFTTAERAGKALDGLK